MSGWESDNCSWSDWESGYFRRGGVIEKHVILAGVQWSKSGYFNWSGWESRYCSWSGWKSDCWKGVIENLVIVEVLLRILLLYGEWLRISLLLRNWDPGYWIDVIFVGMVEILDTSAGVDESLIEGVIETLVFEVGYIEKNVILVWVVNNLVIEVGVIGYFSY